MITIDHMIAEVELTLEEKAEMYKDLLELRTIADYLYSSMGVKFGDDDQKNRQLLRDAAAMKYRSLQVAASILREEANPHQDKGIDVSDAMNEVEKEIEARALSCQFMTTIEEMEPNFENKTFKEMRRRHEIMSEVLRELKKVTA